MGAADWADVHRTTFTRLVRFLYRRVWDAERARDLAQEAFVRVLDDAPDNPRAWIFRVAANLARDEVRSLARRKRHLTLIKAETRDLDPDADPAEALGARERAAAARRALEQLGAREREALLLWDAGLSYAEIAAETGLAPGAIGTTLARARKRLVAAYDAASGAESSHVARG